MSDLPDAAQLAQLAEQTDDPRARLVLHLAASGYDSDQICQARFGRPNGVALPERTATTQALAELAGVLGERNAQDVREAGIKAFATHKEELLGDGWNPSPMAAENPSDAPEDGPGAR
ncbi:hypothetical protein ACWENA_10835 [Streptomyces sp. NPDC004779]